MAFSVEFTELHPYPKSVWQDGVFLGTRQLKCAWPDRVGLLTELDLPANRSWPYPDGPTDALIFKTQLDSLGKQTGAAGTEASYDWAILTCWYHNQGPLLYGNKDLYSEHLGGYSDAEPVPFEDLRWDGAGGPPITPGERPQLQVYGLVYTLTVHETQTIPAWIYNAVRRVNPVSFACANLGITFPAETMLYQPGSVITTSKLSGIRTWNIVMRFLIHPSVADTQTVKGWNTFWRVETTSYEPIYLSNGTRYIQYPGWTLWPWF